MQKRCLQSNERVKGSKACLTFDLGFLEQPVAGSRPVAKQARGLGESVSLGQEGEFLVSLESSNLVIAAES